MGMMDTSPDYGPHMTDDEIYVALLKRLQDKFIDDDNYSGKYIKHEITQLIHRME